MLPPQRRTGTGANDVGTGLDRRRTYTLCISSKGSVMITNHSSGLSLGVGSLAFLAGVFATIVTAYAMVTRKGKEAEKSVPEYGGWDDSLGM